jgi:ribosomal protein L7/L12
MPSDFERSLSAARRMRSEGVDTEYIVGYLRASGLYQIQSIKILREIDGLNLAQAKKLVHLSRTWADTRDADDSLHDSAERALHDLNISTLTVS